MNFVGFESAFCLRAVCVGLPSSIMRTAYGIERNFEGALVLVLADLRLLLGRMGILVKARIERNSRRTNAVHFHHRHNSRLHPPADCAPVQAGEESKRNHLW